MRTIGSKAFYKDGKLKSVAFKGKSVKKVGSKAFKGISKKVVIKAPKSKKKAYQKRVRKAGAPKSVRVKWRHPGMKRSRAFRSMREALFGLKVVGLRNPDEPASRNLAVADAQLAVVRVGNSRTFSRR